MDRLDALHAFVRVVDTGSFTAAARELRISQSAVSKAVARLEEWLGVRLLVRTTRSVRATEAGLRLAERGRPVLDDLEEAARLARGEGERLEGRLRVCSPVTLTRTHLIPRLGAFLERHPNLTLDLVLDDRHVDLVAAGAELAIRAGVPGDSGHVARRVGTSARHLLATEAWIERYGAPGHPSEVTGRPLVGYAWSAEGESWTFRRDDAEVVVRLEPRLSVSAAEGVREAVLAGLGAAVASRWLFAAELARGEVRPLLADWTLPSVDLWCLFPTGRRPTARARAFADFVASAVATEPPSSPTEA